MGCVTTEQLAQWMQSQASVGEQERIESHLKTGCPACTEKLAQWKEGLAPPESPPLGEVPGWLLHQARKLFDWYMARLRGSSMKRMPACLVVDSLAEGALSGFRRARPTNKRLLYRAGDYDIDLLIEYVESDQAIDVIGQVLSLDPSLHDLAGVDVKLRKDSTVVYHTKTCAFGEFLIKGIQEDIYDLELDLRGQVTDVIGFDTTVEPHSWPTASRG